MIGAADKDFKVSESQGTPANFELVGKDGKFLPAQAKIEGGNVIVWSDAVKAPTAVRYAWKDNPQPSVNLYNKAGLPASPFTLNLKN